MHNQENKMGVMPINKLLISMSLPMMISMLVQALYNIVDSIFVAQISENALSAVSLAFPFQQLMISVGTGIGVGVNALLSRYLGAKRPDKANMVAKCGIFLSFLSFIVFALAGLFFTKPFFAFQTNESEILGFGYSYLIICTVGSLGIFGQIIAEKLLVSTGKTKLSMYTQLSGAITNLILDPIMIFGYFGCPALGVAGAALATVIGQWVACFVGFVLNVKCNKEISINMKKFKPETSIIGKIFAIGIPSIIMTSISSVLTFLLNKILISFTTTATAVFGAYFKLQSFIFMPIFGLNNGMVPIVAYNYGAKRPDRIKKTIKYSITYAVSIMITGLLIFQIFPEFLLGFFNASEEMLKIGVPALRTISLSFTFAGICIISCSVFQALGKSLVSMFVSILRQLVVLLPVAYAFSLTRNINLVWFAYPIAEVVAVIFCVYMMIRIHKTLINKLKEPENV